MGKETSKNILSTIQYPDDLRRLKLSQLPRVCEELRQFIIDELSHNPGHFGSTLGVIELTVALHYVYNTPNDRLVWDVGIRRMPTIYSPDDASSSTPTVNTRD